MDAGYIKLYRSMLTNPIFKNSKILHIWIYFLLKANHQNNTIIFNNQEIIIERGSFLTGLHSIARDTGLSIQNARSALTALSKMKMIEKSTSKSTNKFTYLTICNYNIFQTSENQHNKETNKQLTSKQQANNKQLTTNNNDNNDNNDKNKDSLPILAKPKREVKNLYGEYKNIKLTETELAKLKEKLNSHTDEWIEKLSQGIEMKGYKYKNHYLAILNWYAKDQKDKPIWERED